MYLIDTNIFLELLLKQDRYREVDRFLKNVNSSDLYVTEFTIYSIGVILFRLKKPLLFLQWVDDIVKAGVQITRLSPENMKSLTDVALTYNLDFDDAYQYAVADQYDSQIVSFDRDFDRTEKKRKEPSDLLK